MINIPDKILPQELQRKRLIVFIDGNHLYHRMEDYYGTYDINIRQLCETLCTINRSLVEIRYYYTPFKQSLDPNKYRLQQMYVEKFKNTADMKVITGKYIRKPVIFHKSTMDKIINIVTKDELQTYVEKGIDVNIAVDMIHLANEGHYDVAILLSGDSDFVPAITQVRNYRKMVQVAAFQTKENSCYDLINACNSFLNLHHYVPPILFQKAKEPWPEGHSSF